MESANHFHSQQTDRQSHDEEKCLLKDVTSAENGQRHADHIHGPGCSHTHQNKEEVDAKRIVDHVHGPGCAHLHQNIQAGVPGHGHDVRDHHTHGECRHDVEDAQSHLPDSGHVHGPGCNHQSFQKQENLIKIVINNPEKSIAAAMKGNQLFVEAITTLVSLGPDPPEPYVMRGVDLSTGGYASLFASHGMIPRLVELASKSLSIPFIICLANFLQYPDMLIRKQFLESGGVEVLRRGLKNRDVGIQEICRAMEGFLKSSKHYLRICEGCLKRESTTYEWKECAKCRYIQLNPRFSAYCSRECQIANWSNHRNNCAK